MLVGELEYANQPSQFPSSYPFEEIIQYLWNVNLKLLVDWSKREVVFHFCFDTKSVVYESNPKESWVGFVHLSIYPIKNTVQSNTQTIQTFVQAMLKPPIGVKMTVSEARPKLKKLKLCDCQRFWLKCGKKDDRDYRLGLSSSRQFFVFVLFLAIYFIQNLSLSKTLKDSNCLLSHIAYFRNGAYCLLRSIEVVKQI